MQGNCQNVKFAKAVGACFFALFIKTSSGTLGFHNEHIIRQETITFLGAHGPMISEALHFYLDPHLADIVLKEAVVCLIARCHDVFPAFQSSNDINRECRFGDYPPDAPEGQIIRPAECLQDHLSFGMKLVLERGEC